MNTERSRGRQADEELRDAVAAILEAHDPMGLVPEEDDPEFGPFEEYDPEATTIAARLRGAGSEDDVRRIVHEEFLKWFEDDAGPESRYATVAAELWQLKQDGSGPAEL